jgi:hypothetical protein
MGTHGIDQLPILLGLAATVVALLFATRRWRARLMAPSLVRPERHGRMVPLMEAAEAAYQSAKRKRMVIAKVAENAGGADDPVGWFAHNIASVVSVYCERDDGDGFEKLVGAGRSAVIGGVGTGLQSLYIRKRDLRAYLRWASSVQ